MAEQTLLIIDPNPQSLNVMEVQLRTYDYEVLTALSVERALRLLSVSPPDLIISEYALDAGERAVDLCERLKKEIVTSAIPFMIIAEHDQQRVECLNAGADEVLIKPVYIAELRDRAELLLQRKRRLTLEQGVGQRFFGRLEEMGLLDLMQVIEVSKRSGQLMIEHKSSRGSIWFQDGDVHDAVLGDLTGKDALCRLLTWEYGQYEFDFKAAPRPNIINSDLGELRARGLNYVDQWNKMCEQLPPLETVFRKDPVALTERPEPLEALQSALADRFDGKRSTLEVLNRSPEPDLDVLRALTQLYFEGLIYESHEALPEDETPDPAFIDPQLTDALTPEASTEFDIETKEVASSSLTDVSIEDEEATPPPVFAAEEAPGSEIPEEGQDLLAELYAARPPSEDEIIASELSPPPVPEDLQDDGEQADETYSTLFGVGGEFSYDEEESSFFEQFNQEPEDLFAEDRTKEPLSGSAKAFIWILVASLIGVVSYALYDDVYPLKSTQMIRPDWVDIATVGRELNTRMMESAEGEWKLEIINRAVASAPFTPVPEASASAERSPSNRIGASRRSPSKRQETKSFKELMKRALKLMKKSKFRKGVELAERALALKPTSPYALLLSATLHFELGDNKRSLELLQIMVRTTPRYGNTQLGRGYGPGVVYNLIAAAYDNLGNKPEALKYYEAYLRDFPKGVWNKDIKNIVSRLKNSLRR